MVWHHRLTFRSGNESEDDVFEISPLCPLHNMRLRRKYREQGLRCLWTTDEAATASDRRFEFEAPTAQDENPAADADVVSGADPPEFSERGQEGANANIVDDTLMHKDSAGDQEMTSAQSVDETSRCPVIGCRNEWDIVGGRTYVNRAKNVQQAVRINGLCNLHHLRLRRDMKDKAQNTFERRRLRLWTHAEIEEDLARKCAFRD